MSLFGRKKVKEDPLTATYSDGDEITVSLRGRLDSVTSSDFQSDSVPKCRGRDIVLDLEGLVYLSSAGLRSILALDKAGKSLRIVNAKDSVKDVLDMSGFSDFF